MSNRSVAESYFHAVTRGDLEGALATFAAGAEFIVMICGDVMTMPGLPKEPSASRIDINAEGKVVGLF